MASQSGGMILSISGALCIVFGVLISLTGIGLLCGIPMIIVGIPLSIFGGVQVRQATIQAGVKAGLQQGMQPQHNPQWQQPPSVVPQSEQALPAHQTGISCRTCGAPNSPGNKFCSQCTAPLMGEPPY